MNVDFETDSVTVQNVWFDPRAAFSSPLASLRGYSFLAYGFWL